MKQEPNIGPKGFWWSVSVWENGFEVMERLQNPKIGNIRPEVLVPERAVEVAREGKGKISCGEGYGEGLGRIERCKGFYRGRSGFIDGRAYVVLRKNMPVLRFSAGRFEFGRRNFD
jgi:hypothetical protein